MLHQTFCDWTHVIVNDGGNAQELNLLLKEFECRYEGRLKIFHNSESLGMQNASNLGIEGVASEFIVIHDDDDSWHPEFLDSCVSYLDEAGPESIYQGVISQTEKIGEEIVSFGEIKEYSRDGYLPCLSISLFRTAFENPFAPIAFVFRRSAYSRIGPFDQKFDVVGDWDFNLRFLKRFDIGVLSRKLAYYHWRRREDGASFPNTVTKGRLEHEVRANSLKNHYLEPVRKG